MISLAEFAANVIRGGEPAPKKRMRASYLMYLMAITAIVSVAVIEGVLSHWTIGVTGQVTKCLPGDVYLITKSVPAEFTRGQTIAYRSRGLEPLLDDGAIVIKKVAGIPGDLVEVNAAGVFVNQRWWGRLNQKVLRNTGRSVNDVSMSYRLAEDQLLVLGTLPRSYDGRYWGPISRSQVIGTARNLW